MFTENRATFKGRYYTVADAPNNPKPVQKPHPPIMIGGFGEKVMLRLVAKYADHWNCMPQYDDFDRIIGILREHCRAVGRDFATLKISEMVYAILGRNEDEVESSVNAVKSMGLDLKN